MIITVPEYKKIQHTNKAKSKLNESLFDDDWEENVEEGRWSIVDIPEEFAQYIGEITEVVNHNVPWGCCGGCI